MTGFASSSIGCGRVASRKEQVQADLWLKEIAPSTALRKWFGHDPDKWEAFQQRYFSELDDHQEAVATLVQRASQGRLTLLFSARDIEHNQAVSVEALLAEAGRMKDRKHSTSGRSRWTRQPALVYSLVALIVLMLILWQADRLLAARFGAFEPYQQMLWLYRILGLIIVAGLPAIAYLLVLRRGELVSMVEARTSELRAANQQLERQIADRLQTETALRESQQKLQAIFDHAFDGISIYEEIPSDRSHRLIDCNERYAEMAGRTREELLADLGNRSIPT